MEVAKRYFIGSLFYFFLHFLVDILCNFSLIVNFLFLSANQLEKDIATALFDEVQKLYKKKNQEAFKKYGTKLLKKWKKEHPGFQNYMKTTYIGTPTKPPRYTTSTLHTDAHKIANFC